MFTAVSWHLQRQAGPRLCSRGKVMSEGVHPKTCQECSLWKAWLVHLTFQLLQEQEITPRDEHPQIKGTVLALDWRRRNSEVWPYKLNNTLKFEVWWSLSEDPWWKHEWFPLGRQNHLTQYFSGPRFWTATLNKSVNFLKVQSPIFDSKLSEMDPEICIETSWCTGKIGDTGFAPMNIESLFVIFLNQRDCICLTRPKTATEKCLLTLPWFISSSRPKPSGYEWYGVCDGYVCMSVFIYL